MKRIATMMVMAIVCFSMAKAQTDDEFYGSAKEQQKKEWFNPAGPWVLSVGGFYGSRTISLSKSNSVDIGNSEVNYKFHDVKGVNATIENKWMCVEARYGTAKSLTLLSGKLLFGGSLMPRSRFQILLHAGGGYSYNKIDDKHLEKDGLSALDLAARLRMRYYITDRLALYAGGNVGMSIMGDVLYDDLKLNAGGAWADAELGIAFSL